MMLYCPNCRRTDTVRKSSVIVEQGTHQEYVDSLNPYTPGYWRTNRTELVQHLLANKPREEVIGCESGLAKMFLVGIGFICFCVAVASTFSQQNFPGFALGGLIGALICGGSWILLLVTSAARRAKYRRQWTTDLALWEQDFNRQYYCFQCGHIFYV